mmetsp:Transcript_881/g.916  ORF Transcript_881/g.916 Transcript_881/m.916 type:complete len:173 (+) Transcript_881:425-943(+)
MADVVTTESNCARAVKEMQKYDKDFELYDLTYEVEEIFKEFFCNYLSGNLPYLEKTSGGPALAIVKSELKTRETEKWKYKYNDILNINAPIFLGGCIPEKQTAQFTYTIEVQELNCKVDLKDGSIKDGSDDKIIDATYRITVGRHLNPDLELAGHYWEIVEFNKVGELQKIV